MSKADDILFFDVIFLLLVLTFSAGTTSGFDLSQFTSQIFAPWPSTPPLAKIQNCSWFDIGCNIQNQAVAGGIGVVGAGILWFVQMIFSFFNRLIIFGNLITFLMFNPATTGAGVPFLPIIVVGLNIYVVWEVVRTFRGSSTGV